MKKKISKEQKSLMTDIAQHWDNQLTALLGKELSYKMTCCKKKKGHTAKCIKETKERLRRNKLYEAREKRRKAKKITMTVGELEEKLSEARNDHSNDW